jgi:hypothetical protein
VLVVCGYLLSGRGSVLNAAGTAAIGDAVAVGDCISLHTCPVDIGGVDRVLIHVHDRGVVSKLVAAPLAADESDALIAEAIVHAAVVANVTAPVAPMKPVAAAVPVPVIRRPKRTVIRSLYPGSGHPVVVALILIVGPVAGHPHQVGLGADRLLIDGQLRWSESDTDDDLCV